MSGFLDRRCRRPGRRGVLLAGVGAMTLALAVAGSANAAGSLPTYSGVGSNVSVGTSGSTETVTVSSSRAYAEWSAFKVGAGMTFNVAGQAANWILVNKVTGGTGSTVSGTVSANGQVWIIDPNGVTVNAGAQIDVGGLLLSSASWTAADKASFLAGGSNWSFTGATSPIAMNGTITASGGGVVALLGPSVTVGGTVSGGAHTQFLAVAAKDVSLTFADNGTYFTLDGVTIQRGADGGRVQLSSGSAITADRIVVASAGETSAASIVVGGSLTATQARGDGSDIVLLAADGTGPDASPTAQTLISGGAVQALVSGAGQGGLTLQSGATLATSASGGGLYAAANGAVTLGAAAVSTSGPQTWAGPVTLGVDATLTGSSVTFGSTVNGAHSLTVSGDAAFDGAVGGTASLTSLLVGGTTALYGGAVTTTGAQTYTGGVTLGAAAGLKASRATFGSALDGGWDLTVTGNAEFDGAVGVATKLASLSVSGTTALSGGPVTTTGAQTYTGAVSLGADATLNGSAVSFGSTADGGYGLTVDATGQASFAGAVGGVAPLASLHVSAGSISLAGPVQTLGELSLTSLASGLAVQSRLRSSGGAVSIAADGGDLTLGADVDAGAGTLTLTASGAVTQTSGVITAGQLGGSAGAAAVLDDANAVGGLSNFTAQSGFSFVNATGFSAAGVSGGASLSLTASSGDLTLAGAVSGTSTTLVAGAGAIDQTGGVLTTQNLTASSVGGASLAQANRIGTIQSFTNSGGGDLVIADAQSLALVQISSGAATSSVKISSTGAISESAGAITAGQDLVLTAAGDLGLTIAPSVGRDYTVTAASFSGLALAPAFAPGRDFTIDALGPLTLPFGVSAPRNLTIQTQGDLTLAASASAGATLTLSSGGAITQTGGVVTATTLGGSAGTSVTLDRANAVGTLSGFTANNGLSFVNSTGFSASGVAGGSSTGLTALAGDLTLAGDVSGGTTTLTAAGAITQTGGVVTAATLAGSAGTSASLGDANAVGTLSNFAAPGGIVFANRSGFTATGVAGGASTSLTASAGDLTLAGDVSGTTTTLTALTGSITQTGGSVTAGTLTSSAGGSATLTGANAVQNLSGFTASTGLAFDNAGAFSAANVDGGASTSLTAAAGQLTLSGDIAGSSVSLTAGGGPIVQTGGSLTAGILTGSSFGATRLTGSNRIVSLGAFTTYGPGADFTLENAQTLTVTGPVVAGATASGAAEGNLSLTTTAGALNLDGNLSAMADASGTGGIVSLSAAGGISTGDPPSIAALDISVSNMFGSVFLGDLVATRDIAVSSATGSVVINSASAGGNIVLRAPGDISVQNGLSATGSLTGSGAGQMLFASDPTTLAGVAFDLAGSNVDVKAGGSISVGGATTAATDARFKAGGSIAVADVTAGRDIVLDAAGTAAASPPPGDEPPPLGHDTPTGRGMIRGAAGAAPETGQIIVSTGALTATGRDIAVLAETGSAAIGSASAGDDVAIRAAGSVTVTGALTAGASGGADGTGVADQLIGASPSAPIAFAGTVYSNLGQGADVDVKAGWTLAGGQSPGASIAVGAATSAGRDARFQATGAVDLGAVAAGQDVMADGASVAAGALSAANGDVALQASGGVQIASASAGDAIAISSGGVTSVSGALTAAGAGTGDGRLRAGDALANAVLGLAPGQSAGDVVVAAPNVQLGPVSAANGDVLLFARPSGASAGVTYLGGSASSDAQGDFHLDQAEIAGIAARSLNVFAGLTATGSGDVSIGTLDLPQSLPTLRVYTGGAGSRVDVLGPVTGGAGSSLVIGDTQLRSELNPPSSAILALSQGWTPNVIRVEGTIGGPGAGQAFRQVSLSAQDIYIAPVEPGLDFETAVTTKRPEALPVYTGSMTYQIATAALQLSASGPGVIFQRNLARNPSDLANGMGLSVGRITIATIAPADAPPSQIALFGVLSPDGTPLNGLSAAISLSFSSQSGAGAPVRFTPPPAIINLYRFSTCAFGGGACFINVPPIYVPPLPVTNRVGDLTDRFAPTDEEPVTNSGGEIAWPTGSSDKAGQGPG